jgi:regulator of nucleoside diphosphate kinase
MLRRLIVSKLDRFRLTEMLRKSIRGSSAYLRAELKTKILRAKLCEPAQIPARVATMNSRALLLSERWPAARECTLVYPEDANCLEDQISVMSPLGVQLLGAEEGATLSVWDRQRSFQIWVLGLTYQPEAQRHWHR